MDAAPQPSREETRLNPWSAVRTLSETAQEFERRTGQRMTRSLASHYETTALRKLRAALQEYA